MSHKRAREAVGRSGLKRHKRLRVKSPVPGNPNCPSWLHPQREAWPPLTVRGSSECGLTPTLTGREFGVLHGAGASRLSPAVQLLDGRSRHHLLGDHRQGLQA